VNAIILGFHLVVGHNPQISIFTKIKKIRANFYSNPFTINKAKKYTKMDWRIVSVCLVVFVIIIDAIFKTEL
jgi:hypothetical protein